MSISLSNVARYNTIIHKTNRSVNSQSIHIFSLSAIRYIDAAVGLKSRNNKKYKKYKTKKMARENKKKK